MRPPSPRWTLPLTLAVVFALAAACDRGGAERAQARADAPRAGGADEAPAASRPCPAPAGARLADARLPAGYCAWTFAEGLREPRGMVALDGGRVLVVERGEGRVVALRDRDGDGVAGDRERVVLAEAPGLNHGIAVHRGHLYASSATTVWRWPLPTGARGPLGGREVVVRGMPAGGHSTRTLIARGDHLWVSVGSEGNVDADSSRARVVRYALEEVPDGGVPWTDGEVWADGLRNEVGLAFDARGRLWGVQNGVDNLARDDLGGDIHADNPGEELNLLDEPGAFHGYPYCWSEFLLPRGGRGPGTQWAHPRFLRDGRHDDAWCRARSNVTPPALVLQAHTAPLGLAFYDADAFPEAVRGDAFIALHGSWNRPDPVGYSVMRVPFEDGRPGRPEPFLAHDGARATDGSWPHRPVAVAVDAEGRLLVTSDRSGRVIAVAYVGDG